MEATFQDALQKLYEGSLDRLKKNMMIILREAAKSYTEYPKIEPK
jgi:hypothetical protein